MGKNINDCPKGVRSVGEIGKGSGYYEVGRVKAVFFFLGKYAYLEGTVARKMTGW